MIILTVYTFLTLYKIYSYKENRNIMCIHFLHFALIPI